MRSDKNNRRIIGAKSKHDIGANSPQETEVTSGKKTKKRKMKKSFKKRILLTCLAAVGVMVLAFVGYAAIAIIQAPGIDPDTLYDVLSESTVIYDDSGNEIDTVYTDSKRENVEYDQLPDDLVNAFVALEDKTFWDHHGFNFVRIAGAVVGKITGGGRISGTSTITQQLARNLYLKDSRFDRNLKRKIIEAYYAFVIEQKLEKKEILLAYLNTIDFGYHTSGVQAASKAYFSKDVKDLTLAQCAALASLPQAPTTYQLVKFVNAEEVEKTDPNILKETSSGVWIANETSKKRRLTCLSLMKDQGYISDAEYNKAAKTNLKDMLDPDYSVDSGQASYFADYVLNEVVNDLMEEKNWDYSTAYNKVYNGGVKIHSTLDAQAQNVIETEFDNNYNFPNAVTSKDANGNILNAYGGVALYKYENYFDANGRFTFTKDEAKRQSDGSLKLMAGKRLNFYNTKVNEQTDYSVEFKSLYVYDGYQLCSINGGYINIPQQYKSKDDDGNVIISADFFKDKLYNKNFIFNKDGTVTVTANGYTLEQKVVQPQAAMAVVENSTGYVKALVGGRKTTGRRLHNRATSPRQPGSSIKPLTVYSAAIQQSAEEAAKGVKHQFKNLHIDKQGTSNWGNYITPASIVVDERTIIDGKAWPRNATGTFSGPQTVRTALQKSLNTCAVKIFLQVGKDYSANMLEKYGITTMVREGASNDMNTAALALGGMTRGVKPLEMASAYTTYPNNGVRYEETAYTSVEDKNGEIILDNTQTEKYEVLDPGVAWIMTDMLKTVVSRGLGRPATLYNVQAGGKTGTTNDQIDIWFDGFTPNYSAALWIGNDQNFKLTSDSGYAARLWGKIMNKITKANTGIYSAKPSNVISYGGEYFIRGTQGGAPSLKDIKDKEKEKEKKEEEPAVTPSPGNDDEDDSDDDSDEDDTPSPSPSPQPSTSPSTSPESE